MTQKVESGVLISPISTIPKDIGITNHQARASRGNINRLNEGIDMITIEYTSETIENEPGPNFYWQGQPDDYLKIFCDLHILGKVSGEQVILNDLDYLQIKGGYKVSAKSSQNGNRLVYVKEREIEMDLDCAIWREVFSLFLSISFYESHNFVEFDERELIEHCNFIISSEG